MRFLAGATLLCLYALGPVSLPAAAQACPDPGNTFWKNDGFPDVPTGSESVGVVQGLCEGEAAAAIFYLGTNPSQRLTQVAVGIGWLSGTATLELGIEIYDGVSIDSNGRATLGTKVFDLVVEEGSTVSVDRPPAPANSGIFTFDMSPYDVVVNDDFVVAFRMVSNPSGDCVADPSLAYQANFFTDLAGCVAGTDLWDEVTEGWIDPAVFPFVAGLFTLCDPLLTVKPGTWAIRACSENASSIPVASATARNGSGVNPNVYVSVNLPVLGTNWISTVDIASTGASASVIKFAQGGPAAFNLSLGQLLCAPPILTGSSVAFGAHSIPIPADPAYGGVQLCTQAIGFSPGPSLQLYNAIDLVLGQ